MNNKLYLLFITASISSPHVDHISRSWFNPRSISFNSTLNQANTLYNWIWNNQDLDYTISIRPFAQNSTNPHSLADYFSSRETEFETLRYDGSGYVNPGWFTLTDNANQLLSTYSSNVSFAPKRQTFGFILDFKKRFECNECMWVRINTALVYSKNNINLCEKNRTTEGVLDLPPIIKNACDGFSKPMYNSKMQCCSVKKTGLDDIILRLGYDIYTTNKRIVAGWASLTIPTRGNSDSVNLFSPVVGSKSFGLGAGMHWSQLVCEKGCRKVAAIGQADIRYMLESKQQRNFDLTENGNWSRYLIFAHKTTGPNLNKTRQPIPGGSLLNLDAKVSPGLEFNWLSLLHFQHANWAFEIGFNAWWRQAECVKLDTNACENKCNDKDFTDWGILDVQTWINSSGATLKSSSKANISQSFATVATNADTTFTTIKASDLNPCSVAHPATESYTIYASTQYTHCDHTYINLGFAYEFQQNRNALQQYTFFMGLERRF